jgi:hypothetical protein
LFGEKSLHLRRVWNVRILYPLLLSRENGYNLNKNTLTDAGSKMGINLDKVQQWKDDVAKSVDYYNKWFLQFAPEAYRNARSTTVALVEDALKRSDSLRNISPSLIRSYPQIVPILRMATRPPLARDRLMGLADVSKNFIDAIDKKGKLPAKMSVADVDSNLGKIAEVFKKLIDYDLFLWLSEERQPSETEKDRAAIVVADRLCGMQANPIVRNAQEKRQLDLVEAILDKKGYKQVQKGKTVSLESLEPGSYSFRLKVVGHLENDRKVNIPIDVVIRPKDLNAKPIFIEAKSAGDYTNTNKRRKEEAEKLRNIRRVYGNDTPFLLLLGGYFNPGYLGYAAADGIDWIWEHRMGDFELLNI